MNNNYTKEELLGWFEMMINKYPNCKLQENLIQIKMIMFDNNFNDGINTIDNFIIKKKEN